MKTFLKYKLNKTTWLICGLYSMFSLIWILTSSKLIDLLFTSIDSIIWAEEVKGCIFVIVTTGILFLILIRKNKFIVGLIDQIEENEQHLIDTFEHSAIGIVHTSMDERFLLANKKFSEMLGYNFDILKKLKLSDILHKEDLRVSRIQDKKIIRNEINSYIMEKKFITSNNEIFYTRITKSGVRNISGELIYFICLIEEMTEQKAAELNQRVLKKTQEKLLAEVHHRVKNNLAIISGLMELQLLSPGDETLNKNLQQQLIRIRTMAFIYEAHYEDEHLEYVDFWNYLNRFVDFAKVNFPKFEVTFKILQSNIHLNINQAMPCALILGELLIHNFLNDEKNASGMHINMDQYDNNILLEIKSDSHLIHQSSLRYIILKTLATQLNSSCEFIVNRELSHYKFEFEHLTDVKGAYDSRSLYSIVN